MYSGLLFGLVIGLMATPAVRQLARRIGFLDQPDGRRKVHARPTAVGGGAAVLVSIVLAVALAALCGAATPTGLLPLFIAVAVIFTVGLVDDVRQLDGRIKLILQGCVACGFVAVAGAPNAVGLLGLHLPLGLLAAPFAVFWIMGAINSVNLIDGLDGFASVVTSIIALALGVFAAMSGHPGIAMLSLATCGAIWGFAAFNRPPASIFLGDAGSTTIGFVLGALTLRALTGSGTMLLAPALAIWTIPVLDTSFAIARRILRGQGVFGSDREHLHHRLLACLGGPWRVLALTAFCSLALGSAGLMGASTANDLICVSAAVVFVGGVVLTGTLGEIQLPLPLPVRNRESRVAESNLGDAALGFEAEAVATVDNAEYLMSRVESLMAVAIEDESDEASGHEQEAKELQTQSSGPPHLKSVSRNRACGDEAARSSPTKHNKETAPASAAPDTLKKTPVC